MASRLGPRVRSAPSGGAGCRTAAGFVRGPGREWRLTWGPSCVGEAGSGRDTSSRGLGDGLMWPSAGNPRCPKNRQDQEFRQVLGSVRRVPPGPFGACRRLCSARRPRRGPGMQWGSFGAPGRRRGAAVRRVRSEPDGKVGLPRSDRPPGGSLSGYHRVGAGWLTRVFLKGKDDRRTGWLRTIGMRHLSRWAERHRWERLSKGVTSD